MNPDYRSLISIGKFRRLVFRADQALTEFDSLKYGYNRSDKNLSIDILATILVFFASAGRIDPKVEFFWQLHYTSRSCQPRFLAVNDSPCGALVSLIPALSRLKCRVYLCSLWTC